MGGGGDVGSGGVCGGGYVLVMADLQKNKFH